MTPSRSISAGYVDGDAGDEIGITGSQETDHLGLIRRLGDAAQRGALDLGRLVFRALLVPARANALGQRLARRDRVDVDPIGAEFEGELAGEGDDTSLRRGIGAAR